MSSRRLRTHRSAGRLLLGLAAAVCLAAAHAPRAAGAEPPVESFTPLQLAFFHPAQVFGQERSVVGMRLGLLLGVNRNVTGLDVAVGAARSAGRQRGLQVALYNEVGSDCAGLQIGLSNQIDGRLLGAQISALSAHAGDGAGAQVSTLWNHATRLRGFQLGLLNFAGDLKGLQLGLLNFNDNGFLPVFPIFNFGF